MSSAELVLNRRTTRLALLGLILLHVLVVGLYAFSVIPQEFHEPEHLFRFHNGGDNAAYYELAQSMVRGELTPSKYPIGFPLTLVPFIAIIQPQSQEQLLEPVAAFWSLIMFPVAQILLYQLGKLLTGRRGLALIAVLVWTLLPLAIWLGLRLVFSAQMAETNSVHLIWAQMLSDGPATLLTIVAFLLLALLRKTETARPEWTLAAGLGMTLGALILLRYTSALTAGAILLLLALDRRWRLLIVVALLMALVASLQLAYNWAFFGNPFTTGYTVLDALPDRGLFHPSYLTDAIAGLLRRSPLALAAGLIGAGAFFAASLWATWRLNRWAALALALWIIPYVAFYSIYYYSWTGSLLRFLIPVYPALAILAATLFTELWAQVRRRAR